MNEELEKQAKDFMYDNFALGNECHKFGSWNGCKPYCPVFERGECELQEENEKRFSEEE